MAGELSEIVSEGEEPLEDEGDINETAKSPSAEDYADISEVSIYVLCLCDFARVVVQVGHIHMYMQ